MRPPIQYSFQPELWDLDFRPLQCASWIILVTLTEVYSECLDTGYFDCNSHTCSTYFRFCPPLSLSGWLFISCFLSLCLSHHCVSASLSLWPGLNQPSRLSLLGLNNVPWLAHRKFDCTMTSWPPEPADWLTLKVGDGERGGCTRADVTGGLMGNRETDAAHCLQALSFCCSHFEFLSSLLSNRLQLLTCRNSNIQPGCSGQSLSHFPPMVILLQFFFLLLEVAGRDTGWT